jgi:hypothetical protein
MPRDQYGLTFPVFEHFGVGMWVPEVGGPIDPANEAHDMIMSVFGGLNKGERNRIKIRVRAAMAAITATEGRYLDGRLPYGYRLADAGPHPNPSKAADGKRLHRLGARSGHLRGGGSSSADEDCSPSPKDSPLTASPHPLRTIALATSIGVWGGGASRGGGPGVAPRD